MQGAVTGPSRETRVLGEYEVVVAKVHGDIRQVVHVVADDLFSRIDALGGLNAPRVGIRETRRVMAAGAAADIDIPSLPARLESGGAYLGRQW